MTVRHIEETHRRQKQKPGATELVFILDCSGSMAGMESDDIILEILADITICLGI